MLLCWLWLYLYLAVMGLLSSAAHHSAYLQTLSGWGSSSVCVLCTGVCVRACMRAWVCVCALVCMCEREREKMGQYSVRAGCVCVCLEREREREKYVSVLYVCVKERDVVYTNKWFVRGKIVFMFSVSFCLLETPEKGDHFPKWMCFCDIKSPQRCPANVSRQMPQTIHSFLCQNEREREREREKMCQYCVCMCWEHVYICRGQRHPASVKRQMWENLFSMLKLEKAETQWKVRHSYFWFGVNCFQGI